jgi:hypothetical protein
MADGLIGHLGVGRYGDRIDIEHVTPSGRAVKGRSLMGTDKDEITVRRSVNDANEGLRIRLAGQPLPERHAVESDLQRLVLLRLDPKAAKNDEGAWNG